MSIIYKNNKFRSGKPQFALPGDHDRAREIGLERREQRAVSFIDGSVANIFQILGRKGWDLPGIDITFSANGSDEAPVHYISSVKGDLHGQKWAINMGRCEHHTFHDVNVPTAATSVIVPQQKLTVLDNGKGVYAQYDGQDWDADQEYFFDADEIHSQQNMFRTYHQNEHSGQRFIYDGTEGYPIGEIASVDDLGISIKFDLSGEIHYSNAADSYEEIEIFMKIDEFLEQVIEDLECYPDIAETPYQKWEQLMAVEEKPLPAAMPSLFIACEYQGKEKDTHSILEYGQRHLCPPRYASSPNFPVPKAAVQGFNFAFADKPSISETGLYGSDPAAADVKIYKVNLKNSNDIYVVDEQPLIVSRNYYASEHENVKNCTPEEKSAQYASISKTMTPLSDYKNDFKKPIYLIGRPLQNDEVVDVKSKPALWRDNVQGLVGNDDKNEQGTDYLKKPKGPHQA